MPESPERLLQRVRLGEDSSIELKEVTFSDDKVKAPGPDELADALAAFANGRGGTLVLGVDESRQILGIPPEQQETLERHVTEVVRDSIEPPLYPDIYWCELPNAAGRPRPVLRLEIPSCRRPHWAWQWPVGGRGPRGRLAHAQRSPARSRNTGSWATPNSS